MRTIEFRAWDKRLRVMFHFFKPDFCMEYGTLSFKSVENPGICNFPTETDFANWELMQFTGLHDKNGEEIYEGDILNSHNGTLQGFVVYQGPSFVVKRRENAKTWHEFILHPTEKQFQEVIGNIHENPELLK